MKSYMIEFLPMSVHFLKAFQNTRGQAVLEAALMLPFVTLLFFGMIIMGYSFLSQQVITYASREGARAGALTNENQQIVAATRSIIQYIDPNNSLTKVDIVPHEEGGRSRGNPLTVRIEYMVPFQWFLSQSITLHSETTMRIE